MLFKCTASRACSAMCVARRICSFCRALSMLSLSGIAHGLNASCLLPLHWHVKVISSMTGLRQWEGCPFYTALSMFLLSGTGPGFHNFCVTHFEREIQLQRKPENYCVQRYPIAKNASKAWGVIKSCSAGNRGLLMVGLLGLRDRRRGCQR